MARNATKRQCKRNVSDSTNAKQIRSAFKWFFQDPSLENLKCHGNTKWQPMHLVVQALLWVLSKEDQLTDAFDQASKQCEDLYRTVAVTTYQGLLKALVRWTDTLMPMLIVMLHDRIDQIAGCYSRIGGFYPLACDGSKPIAPRTKSNEKTFVSPTYGQGKNAKHRKKKKKQKGKTKNRRKSKTKPNKVQQPAPMVLVTMLWHLRLRLPWCWKVGGIDADERQHLLEMINSNQLPEKTLFVADAGFVGYQIWRQIIDSGQYFLIRVGANINLLQQMGYHVQRRKDIVYCWPDEMFRRHQPPLKLRMIRVKFGQLTVTLLTNVLEKSELSNKLAHRLYKLRWGIEVQFRALKQTFKCRKLRCRNGERVLVELNWSVLAMTIVELFALQAQLPSPAEAIPNISFAKSLKAVRRALESLYRPSEANDTMNDHLSAALVDDYERSSCKTARYKPSSSHRLPAGGPKIRILQEKHLKRLRQLGPATAA